MCAFRQHRPDVDEGLQPGSLRSAAGRVAEHQLVRRQIASRRHAPGAELVLDHEQRQQVADRLWQPAEAILQGRLEEAGYGTDTP